MANKVCPVVLRLRGGVEVLAFRHPEAGLQLVGGSIGAEESVEAAALRGLKEEAGVDGARVTGRYGACEIDGAEWHFVRVQTSELPESWAHRSTGEGGHESDFFWHDLAATAGDEWPAHFRAALAFIADAVDEVRL